MKKIIAVICTVLTFTVLSGCTPKVKNNAAGPSAAARTTAAETSPAPVPVPEVLNLQDYFPLKENVKYIYAGKGNEYAAYTVLTDYVERNKVQQRINNGGTETVRVIELKDGKLTRLLSKAETYYRENLLEADAGEEEILLKEPVVTGNTWKLKDGSTRTITDTSAEISTTLGSFEALEVTTESTKGKTTDYYVKDMGLAKTVFRTGNEEVSSTIEKIEDKVYLKQSINFYYPKTASQKLYFVRREINFKTNDITKKLLEETYKGIIREQSGKDYGAGVKTNSLYLNKDNRVYIDFNSALITEIDKAALSAPYEKLVLQSIANTVGGYYNVKNVIITVENKPYKSKNLTYGRGEPVKAELENAIEEEK